MTPEQFKLLQSMPLGRPMLAFEVVKAGGGGNSNVVGHMCRRLPDYIEIVPKRGNRPARYTRVRPLPEPKQQREDVRTAMTKVYPHTGLSIPKEAPVSLPREPWEVRA